MPVTFPRDLPDPFKVNRVDLSVIYQQATAPTRGGQPQVANIGADLWRIAYDTIPLAETEAEFMISWLHSLRGGARTFRAWSPLRRWAIAYPGGYGGLTRAGGGAFDGNAALSAVATLRDTLTINTLPANFRITAGDLISWSDSASRVNMHRVLETVTAGGTGAATLSVEPIVRPGFTLGTSVALIKPSFLAVLDAASVQIRWQRGRRATVSFTGTQVLV